MPRILLALVPAVLALCACTTGAAGDAREVPGVVPYVAGHTVVFPDGTTRALTDVPRPRLQGADTPLIAGVAGGALVYDAYDERVRLDPQRTAEQQGVNPGDVLGTPTVREAGPAGDRLLVNGAFGVAVSPGGRVAVALLADPVHRFGSPNDTAVAVLEPGAATAIRWTEAGGQRVPVAWAGDTLLYSVPGDGPLPDLWAATGPGTGRLLARAGSFVASSPDRERVLVAVADPERGGLLTLEVLAIRDGRLLARLPTDLWWAGLGSWTANGIVAVGTPRPGTLSALDLTADLQLRHQTGFAVAEDLAAPPNQITVAGDGRSFGVMTYVATTALPDIAWVRFDCSITEDTCRRADLPKGTEYAGLLAGPAT